MKYKFEDCDYFGTFYRSTSRANAKILNMDHLSLGNLYLHMYFMVHTYSYDSMDGFLFKLCLHSFTYIILGLKLICCMCTLFKLEESN